MNDESDTTNKSNIQAILKLCREIASEDNVELTTVVQCAIVNELWNTTNVNITQLGMLEAKRLDS